MREKIEVWPKIVALVILLGIPFMMSVDNNSDHLIWLLIMLSVMQIYILLVNDERVFDIHKRLLELEKREENKSDLR
jgi:hypothetical protein